MDSIFADIFIILCALALVLTLGITTYSVVRSLRTNRRPKSENGVPVRKIEICTLCGLLLVSLPTLLFGSLTDMCIITSIIMLLAASCAVVTGRIISARLRKRV